MKPYTYPELDRLGAWMRSTLTQVTDAKHVAHAVVGRTWPYLTFFGEGQRYDEVYNIPDPEMANALLVLAEETSRNAVIDRFEFIGVDFEALTEVFESLDPSELGEEARAARWLYLNRTFWWPRWAHGERGRTGPSNWDELLRAVKQAVRFLRHSMIVSRELDTFVAEHDRADTIVLCDLTGVPDTRKATALPLATKALQVVIAPGTMAFRAPREWHREGIKRWVTQGYTNWSGNQVGVAYSNRPLPAYRQAMIHDVAAEHEDYMREQAG